LHNEVPTAAVPGAPLLGLLVEGSQVGGLPAGRKEGEGCGARALHAHLLEEAACPFGAHCCREHGVHGLVHPTTQPCTSHVAWIHHCESIRTGSSHRRGDEDPKAVPVQHLGCILAFKVSMVN